MSSVTAKRSKIWDFVSEGDRSSVDLVEDDNLTSAERMRQQNRRLQNRMNQRNRRMKLREERLRATMGNTLQFTSSAMLTRLQSTGCPGES